MKHIYSFMFLLLAIFILGGCSKKDEITSPSEPFTFPWTFNKNRVDFVNSVQQTVDGGYIIAGSTGHGFLYDAWVFKTDININQVWDKTFGDSANDMAFSVQQTADGGYIIAGLTESFGAGGSDAWLIKTDANGNKVWDKTYGGNRRDHAHSVQQIADGGYIMAGFTESFGAGGYDAWLIKTDANGNKMWDKTYGGTGDEFANVVQQTADGGYIIAGITKSFGAGDYDFWLIKTDANGNKVWDKTFGGNRMDYANFVQQTADGGYIMAGLTESFGAGGSDAWLIKTDVYGNKMWDKTYGGTGDDTFAQVTQQTLDGGYVSAGATIDRGDAWLIKTDVNGNKIWDKTFGGSDWDEAYCVQQTADGGYIIAGRTRSSGFNYFDYVWLIKTDANGNIVSEP